MSPIEEAGLGLTLEEACALWADESPFGLTEETIRSYWGKRKELREKLRESRGEFRIDD